MIISVASGKGGTGKTLVATSLAISLKDEHKVQLLDCDVEEPNDHIFLKPVIDRSETVSVPVPMIDEEKCTYCGICSDICAYNAIAVFGRNVLVFPELCHGCGACRYFCPEKAIVEKKRRIGIVESSSSDGIAFVQGKLAVGEAIPIPVIRKVKEHTDSDGIVITDVSPGTSCPVVQSIVGSDFCLLVTEPTPFGFNDLALAVETVRELNIPCGVVINRFGVGDTKVEEYCIRENIPILLTIPMDAGIARLYSRGITLAEGMPQWKEIFLELFKKIKDQVNERSRYS
jgi:MinD superfamily P-loop ATPase